MSKIDAVIVGAGYVGLTLALHMASRGMSILAIDTDKKKIEALQQGKTYIFEEGISEVLQSCLQSGNLKFATEVKEGAPFWILSIPYFPGDIQHYLDALNLIKGREGEPPVIAIRGTVPVGYIRTYILPRLEKQFAGPLDEAFYLTSAPERSLSGAALEELATLPQLVGGSDKSVEKTINHFSKADISCIPLPKLEAGELAKVFTNFTRLVQFNLSNFFGTLCHLYDISEEHLTEAVKAGYPRLNCFNVPGPGVGGFCLPKDALILYDSFANFRNIKTKVSIDENIKEFPRRAYMLNEGIIKFHAEMVSKLTKNCRNILAVGVAFKGRPKTDDMRNSVGVKIVRYLIANKRKVEVFDRTISDHKLRSKGLPIAPKPLNLLRYDALLLLNNDSDYKKDLLSVLPEKAEGTVTLYDPWRILVTGKESIFQLNYPLNSLRMHMA